jgi:hypothetical protein
MRPFEASTLATAAIPDAKQAFIYSDSELIPIPTAPLHPMLTMKVSRAAQG